MTHPNTAKIYSKIYLISLEERLNNCKFVDTIAERQGHANKGSMTSLHDPNYSPRLDLILKVITAFLKRNLK